MDRARQLEIVVRWVYRLSPAMLRWRLKALTPSARRRVAGGWLRAEVGRLEAVSRARRALPPAATPLHAALNAIAARLRAGFPQMNRGGCGIVSRVVLEELVARELEFPMPIYMFDRRLRGGPVHVLLRLSDGNLFDVDFGVHRWGERGGEEVHELRASISPSRAFLFHVTSTEFVHYQIRLGLWGARSYERAVEEMRDILVEELDRLPGQDAQIREDRAAE